MNEGHLQFQYEYHRSCASFPVKPPPPPALYSRSSISTHVYLSVCQFEIRNQTFSSFFLFYKAATDSVTICVVVCVLRVALQDGVSGEFYSRRG